jgi:hypothetical protein
MHIKQKIYSHYLKLLLDKIALLQQVLNDLKESGSNETKSTAGDKHETALAMLQIEQANKRNQMQELLLQKAALEKINPAVTAPMVVSGSLIKTNQGWLYMSVALGRAAVDDIAVIALSPQSPLGKNLMGLKVSDTCMMNNIEYRIESLQ